MTKNQDDITLLPINRADLYDETKKLGTIEFTKDEKVALAKLVDSRVWDILKGPYTKQRLMQIAVTGLNMAQTNEELDRYKGRAAEANHMLKEIEQIVKDFQQAEKTPKS